MKTILATVLLLLPLSAAAESDSWPRFGGATGDFKVSNAELATTWPKDGPPELWRRPLGGGYGGIAVDGDVLYVLYLDGENDVATALKTSDGTPLWKQSYPNKPREANQVQFGRGPNTTPLVLADRLVTLGYNGELKSLSRDDGKVLWSHNLIPDFAGEVLKFGYSASPIEWKGNVIVAVGGEKHGIAAFDPKDGSVVWSGPPSSVTYATPIVANVDGENQLLYFSADELISLNADNGKELWRYPIANQYKNHGSMPIWGDDNVLWLISQLEAPGRALRLSRGDDGKTQLEELWKNDRLKIHFWNTIRVDNVVYGAIGGKVQFLAGIDIKNGEILWRERGYSQLNMVHTANGTLGLDATGTLSLLDLSPKGMTVRAQAKLFEDQTWTAPTLVGDKLYIRDRETIRAYDLAPK